MTMFLSALTTTLSKKKVLLILLLLVLILPVPVRVKHEYHAFLETENAETAAAVRTDYWRLQFLLFGTKTFGTVKTETGSEIREYKVMNEYRFNQIYSAAIWRYDEKTNQIESRTMETDKNRENLFIFGSQKDYWTGSKDNASAETVLERITAARNDR